MARTVAIGGQDFKTLRENNAFYVDKTLFIKDWWDNMDSVTLITRPRRFGKTLNMSMLSYFFSSQYPGRSNLFEGLDIWEEEKFRKLQGTYPVIFLTFAGVKGTCYEDAVAGIKKTIVKVFEQHSYLRDYDKFGENEKLALGSIRENMKDIDAAYSLNLLSTLLEKYYAKKVLIFLDEYDTPLQEAYVQGYWEKMTAFIRTMFNNTFKTNPSMERAVMTGITRVSKESIFSDLNNLVVITTTSELYASYFGFKEDEVYAALEEQGYSDEDKRCVKLWYDGFTFGTYTDIYNPWSITHFLKFGKLETYWANTSGNGLVGHLLKTGSSDIKMEFEKLLKGEPIEAPIDEQIIYDQLDDDEDAVWSLLLASGYLKVLGREYFQESEEPMYTLGITNHEVSLMFKTMVRGWFKKGKLLSKFVAAMLSEDVEEMNYYMNDIALATFSSSGAGDAPSGKEPERFYHGFVLGLLVDKAADYEVKSNRESGYGRYDVMLIPKDKKDVAVIMEFKVFDEAKEKELTDTADRALEQIETKQYATDLISQGVPEENIRKYGFAFQGKKCLIRSGKTLPFTV